MPIPYYRVVTRIRDQDDADCAAATQGAVLYFDGAKWKNLEHGSVGEVLRTGGAAANPFYASYVPNWYLGNGVTHAVPVGGTVQATSGVGDTIDGANLTLAGGQSTGWGTPGSVLVKVSSSGTGADTDANPLYTLAQMDDSVGLLVTHDAYGVQSRPITVASAGVPTVNSGGFVSTGYYWDGATYQFASAKFGANAFGNGTWEARIVVGVQPRLTVNQNGQTLISANATAGTVGASAMLQVDSTTRGMLPPRMTTAQRDAIGSPAEGLLVYNTTTHQFDYRAAAAWAGVGDLTNAVILAPDSATRNRIQPTADYPAIVLRNNGAQAGPILSHYASNGTTLQSSITKSGRFAVGTSDETDATDAFTAIGNSQYLCFRHGAGQRAFRFGVGSVDNGTFILQLEDDANYQLRILSGNALSGGIITAHGMPGFAFETDVGGAPITFCAGPAGQNEIAFQKRSADGYIGGTGILSFYGATKTFYQSVAANPIVVIQGASSQTGALLKLQQVTTVQAQDAAILDAAWYDATDASRKGDLILSAVDSAATREGIRIRGTGTAGAIGVLGATPIARPNSYTLTGSVTRTMPTDPSGAYTGIDKDQVGTPYAQLTDLNTLRSTVSTLLGVVKQLITDLGSTSGYGWLAHA